MQPVKIKRLPNGSKIFWSAADTLFEPISTLCESNKMPFALGDKYPLSDDTKAMLRDNPYFVGAVSTPDIETGADMAKAALADGGAVLGAVHCADPSEAVRKSNDLMTAYPDAGCLYGSGGDYSVGAL